jgi:hypothetical protein
MSTPPARPSIFHITHVDNLASIVADGGLLCDRGMIERGGPPRAIGMSNIKRRRIEQLEVGCHPGTRVGDYVPFYFCPRSVMLFVIDRANHPELTYRGGQEPIVHLEANLHGVIAWADRNRRPWCFSLANAGARYAEFRSRAAELNQLDWLAIAAQDFRSSEVKERKQAEFLLHERFPWELVERVGVCSEAVQARAAEAIQAAPHRPPVEVRRAWYY